MNIAIILSGGVGARMGAGRPKQYLEVEGRTIFSFSMETLMRHPLVDAIVVVCAPEWQGVVDADVAALDAAASGKEIIFALPGETRQLSVFSGMEEAAERWGEEAGIVLVQDAARPNTSPRIITDCIRGVADGYDGAMPAVRVKDTIYLSDDGKEITSLLDRTTLYAGQAPEAFAFRKYLEAHRRLSPVELKKITGSSELAHRAGLRVRLIKGEAENFKITDKEDIERFRAKRANWRSDASELERP